MCYVFSFVCLSFSLNINGKKENQQNPSSCTVGVQCFLAGGNEHNHHFCANFERQQQTLKQIIFKRLDKIFDNLHIQNTQIRISESPFRINSEECRGMIISKMQGGISCLHYVWSLAAKPTESSYSGYIGFDIMTI